MDASGAVAALYRHPVKGFTPERLDEAALDAGATFPCDRLYALERGDSGFDPAAPRHLSKWRFAVLANHPRLAAAATAYDERTCVISVRHPQAGALRADLSSADGRSAFAAWIAERLGGEEDQPLRVVGPAGDHRFMDDEEGFVSLVNLASVRDLAGRVGREIDPLRLRANIHVEGWAPWCELGLGQGARVRLGETVLEAVKPIPRCIATHVDPASGERDLDVLAALREHYGHTLCGLYLRVSKGGRVREGDVALANPSEFSPPCPPLPSSRRGPPPATG